MIKILIVILIGFTVGFSAQAEKDKGESYYDEDGCRWFWSGRLYMSKESLSPETCTGVGSKIYKAKQIEKEKAAKIFKETHIKQKYTAKDIFTKGTIIFKPLEYSGFFLIDYKDYVFICTAISSIGCEALWNEEVFINKENK
tara:strand:- start:79 stop:504 length:426 start_codon:yes stop_codon:yes gene_type:complete